MRPKTVIYFKTFPINGTYWEKVGIEMELDEGDDPKKALYECKKTVQNFHYESNKADEKKSDAAVMENENIPIPVMPLTKVADLIKEINLCKSYEVLERVYKYIASTDPDIQRAYDKRRKELRDAEVTQIIKKTDNLLHKSKKNGKH